MAIKKSSTENFRYNNYYVFNLIISFYFIAISLILYIINISITDKLMLFAWIGNFILLWGIFAFKKIKSTHINPYTFFFISYFIFSYGQIFLHSIGLKYDSFNLIQIFAYSEIINYCLYFCIGTCFFLLGALNAIRKDIIVDRTIISFENNNDVILIKSMRIVAWVMFIISAPVYLQTFITNLTNSIKYGYNIIYEISESSSISNIVSSFSMLFVPSLFILLVTYKKKKCFKWFILLGLLLICIGTFAIGTRSQAMAIIISLLYLWDAEIRKFNKFDKVLLILSLVVIFSILPVIQSFRGVSQKSIGLFKETLYFMKSNNNLITDIIGGLGGSMQPWLLVNRLIPDVYNFKFGLSYIASLLAIIPSLLFGGFSFTRHAQLAGWLQKSANMNYGPGFSILAEAYYNFGWFGLPILFIIGWFYFKLISNNMFKGKIVKYKSLFSAIALFLFITSARDSMYLTIRVEVYVILLPITCIMFIYGNLLKKTTKREKI